MDKKFGKHIKNVCNHKTPGMPKFLVVRPTEEYERIYVDQWRYWSGVHMVLYLVTHSCLNLANATRELSKANNRANFAAQKELLHVIEYV